MRLSEIQHSIRFIGLSRTLADLVFRALNRLVLLHVLEAVVIEEVNPRLLDCDPGYRFCRLDEATLRRFAADPAYELTERFLRDALGRGDECYGFLLGDVLAAYSWHTRLPTMVGLPGLAVHFSARYVHVFKGFTHPDHRGRRLHGAGMTKALTIHLERGAKGLVTYVDLTSFAARRSVRRTGCVALGSMVILRLLGHYRLWASQGCKRCEFRFHSSGPEVPGSDGPSPVSPAPLRSPNSCR